MPGDRPGAPVPLVRVLAAVAVAGHPAPAEAPVTRPRPRCAAGAAFLDEHDPTWWQRVDLPTLDLLCASHCVLGQTCPLEVLDRYTEQEYEDGTEADPDDRYVAYATELSGAGSEREVDAWAEEHGFTVGRVYAGAYDPWLDLTTEWKQIIAARRAAR